MSELLKKLYTHEVSMDDLMNVRERFTPKFQGMRITEGMIGIPFFVSELGNYNGKSVGIITTPSAVASYNGSFDDTVEFTMKYLKEFENNPKSNIRASGKLDACSGKIEGVMKSGKNLEWEFIFYESASQRGFYDMVEKHFNIF